MKCIANNSRFHPCWVGRLRHTGSILPPEELVKSALGNRVEAMRLFFGGLLRIEGVSYRLIYLRMTKFKNLFMEISGIHANGLIENMVNKFGSSRLIFGTLYPWFGAGQVKIALAYADVSREERESIAYKNLNKLIKGIRE